MSNVELREESDWHVAESERLLAEVREVRARALEAGVGQEASDLLLQGSQLEADAEAHRHQARILLAACRPSDAGPVRHAAGR